jgi:predicted nucleotidyltransferase
MAETSVSIQPHELRCINAIFKNIIPDREIWAFGSRTLSNHKPFSDLDLVVMGDSPLSIEKKADLNTAFSDSDLTFKVDVVVWFELTENFKNIIKNHYVVIKPIQSL